jgi:hypothetical protein
VSFRDESYRCLRARSEALFELTDALLLRTGGAVRSLVELALAAEHRAATTVCRTKSIGAEQMLPASVDPSLV